MNYKGWPSVEEYVAFKVTGQTRYNDEPRCGTVLCFEALDNANPAQLDDRVVHHEACVCDLAPEQADFAYCRCGAADRTNTVIAGLRRQYATQIDLGRNL